MTDAPYGRSDISAKLATLYYFKPCAKLATLPENYSIKNSQFLVIQVERVNHIQQLFHYFI